MTPINEAKPKQQGQKTNLNDEPLAGTGYRLNSSRQSGIDWIREAIAEKLQRESLIFVSAEAKAIQRLDRLENPDHYITIGEAEEQIDIEAINKHLETRGKKQISVAD